MASKKSRERGRAPVRLLARYRSPSAFEFVADECTDVSSGGMFIQTAQPAPVGTLLKVECDTDPSAGEVLRTVCRVIWLREGPEDANPGPAGMGVKFVKLDADGEDILARLMERLEPRLEADGIQLRGSLMPPAASFAPEPTPELASPANPPPDDAPAGRPSTGGEALVQPTRRRTNTPWTVHAAKSADFSHAAHGEVGQHLAEYGYGATPSAADFGEEAEPAQAEHSGWEAETDRVGYRPSEATVVAAEELLTDSDPQRFRDSAPAEEDTVVPSQRGLGSVWMAFAAVVLLGGAISLQLSRQRQAADPVVPRHPAATNAQAPAPAGAGPAANPQALAGEVEGAASQYLLEVETEPTGAEVQVGETRLTAPAQVALTNLVKPVKVHAKLAGHDPTATTIEAAMFEERNGRRYKKITLQLTKTP